MSEALRRNAIVRRVFLQLYFATGCCPWVRRRRQSMWPVFGSRSGAHEFSMHRHGVLVCFVGHLKTVAMFD